MATERDVGVVSRSVRNNKSIGAFGEFGKSEDTVFIGSLSVFCFGNVNISPCLRAALCFADRPPLEYHLFGHKQAKIPRIQVDQRLTVTSCGQFDLHLVY